MKKIVIILFVTLSVLVMTGCSKKINVLNKDTFTCTRENSEERFKFTENYTFSYDKNDNIDNFEADIYFKFDEANKDEYEVFVKQLKNPLKIISITYTYDRDDLSFNIKFSGSIKKLALLAKVLGVELDSDIANNKGKESVFNALNDKGYSCNYNK